MKVLLRNGHRACLKACHHACKALKAECLSRWFWRQWCARDPRNVAYDRARKRELARRKKAFEASGAEPIKIVFPPKPPPDGKTRRGRSPGH